MPSLRALEMLIAVADVSSITDAARRLHLTQPAISHQLARLEQEVGVALLDRGARGVTLTPEGRAFVEHARLAVAAVGRAIESTRSGSDGPTIRLAAAESFTVPFTAPVIGEWHAAGRSPLEIAEIASVDAGIRGLVDGDHDVVVVPGPLALSGLHVEALGVEEIVAVVGTKRSGPTSTSLADLASGMSVGVDASNGFREWISARFAEQGLIHRTDIATRSLQNAAAIAAAGLGSAVVPISATSPEMPIVSLQPRLLRHVVAVTRSRPTGALAEVIVLIRRRITSASAGD